MKTITLNKTKQTKSFGINIQNMAGFMLFKVYVQVLLHYTVLTGFISRGDLVKKAVGY